MPSKIVERLKQLCPLGIDLDSKHGTGLKLLSILFNLEYAFPSKKIRVFKTRYGFHFEVDFQPTNMDVRRALRDCSGRLWYSELRGGDDVLFSRKRYAHERKWHQRVEIAPDNLWRNHAWKEGIGGELQRKWNWREEVV